MIVRGKSRGWGGQLGNYLEAKGENETVTPLEVRGTAAQDVRRAVLEMSMRCELTKRGKLGLYHAQIAPAYGEDDLTPEQWKDAADQLEKSLGLQGQPRVIVLHEKKGKVHGHLVWQREKDGKLIKMSHSYRAHDRVRAELERQHKHQRTRQPSDHKEELTRLWASTKDGQSFAQAAQEAGYTLARGDRRPFQVVTPDGEKLDLVRQLQGVKTAQARERMASIEATLPHESQLEGKRPATKREQLNEGRKRRAEKEKPQVRPKAERVGPEPETALPANDNRPTREQRATEAGISFGDVVERQPEPALPPTPKRDPIREAQERTKAAREAAERTAKEAGKTLDDITESDPIKAAQMRRDLKRQHDRERGKGRDLERD